MIQRRFVLLSLLPCLAFAAGAPNLALASGGGQKKKGGGALFTQLPMITVFTSGGGGRKHGSMSVEVGLYAADDKMGEQIKLFLPRLQDAYVMRLQAYAAGLNASSLTNTDYIATQLQAATNKVLGHSGAKVLLGSVMLN